MSGVRELFREALRDPKDGSKLVALGDEHAEFTSTNRYRCLDGRPILIDETRSFFAVEDVVACRPTTQDREYRTDRSLKNYIRKRMLPGLTWDRGQSARRARLAAGVAGQPVLVIGCGDRGDEYRAMFPDSTVVTSDVHLQFGADVAFDAHSIPFADRTFGLVLAEQVLEHTGRPWIVCNEMQRVTRPGGLVHIEVPFEFPYHGAPYDFYRFTPTALRLLFARSELVELDITEGRFSSAAVLLSTGVVDSFVGRRVRQLALAGTRLGLWWLKYLDARDTANRFTSPKGLYITVRVDDALRDDRACIEEVERLLTR